MGTLVERTKVSRKNQVTLPVAALREAGVAPGDVLRVEMVSDGVFKLIRERDSWWDLFEKLAGSGGGSSRTPWCSPVTGGSNRSRTVSG
jgi:bifunctional DNA-binding transcriptional regulator/antitoxin component of YhaV-PrlF toxin-antitoxin module